MLDVDCHQHAAVQAAGNHDIDHVLKRGQAGAAAANQQPQVFALDIELGAGSPQAVGCRFGAADVDPCLDVHQFEQRTKIVGCQLHFFGFQVFDIDIRFCLRLCLRVELVFRSSRRFPGGPLLERGHPHPGLLTAQPKDTRLAGRQHLDVHLGALQAELFEGDVDGLIDGFCAYLYAFHGRPSLCLPEL